MSTAVVLAVFFLYTHAGRRLSHSPTLEERDVVHIGLFGGSFDPPHICHTLFCLHVLEMTDVEKILWVPCVEHPFGKTAAAFEHRLAMSRLAARSLGARTEVSEIEATLPRPSYTIHTVEALRRRMPDARVSVLIGSDNVDEIDRWEQIDALRTLADFVVVPRGGFVTPGDEMTAALPALSSSAIRNALREGRSVERVLAPAVRAYIEQHKLYRG